MYDLYEVLKKFDRSVVPVIMLSTGKDSIAQLDLLANYFNKVVAVHLYMVKGLEYRDIYIKLLLSRYKNVKFLYLPHHALPSINEVYGRSKEQIGSFDVSQKEMETVIRNKTKCEWLAYGFRKDESLQRRGMLSKVKGKDEKTKRFYPLYNFTIKHVDKYIKRARLPLPPEYECNFRDIGFFDSPESLNWLEDNYPNDYKRLLEQFPNVKAIRMVK